MRNATARLAGVLLLPLVTGGCFGIRAAGGNFAAGAIDEVQARESAFVALGWR